MNNTGREVPLPPADSAGKDLGTTQAETYLGLLEISGTLVWCKPLSFSGQHESEDCDDDRQISASETALKEEKEGQCSASTLRVRRRFSTANLTHLNSIV